MEEKRGNTLNTNDVILRLVEKLEKLIRENEQLKQKVKEFENK